MAPVALTERETEQPETEHPTYTIAETAKKLRKGINQTYEAVHKGEIPSIKIGERYYVPAWFFRNLVRGATE